MLKTNATWHLLRLRSGQTCVKIAEFLCVYASPRKCFATGLFSVGLIGFMAKGLLRCKTVSVCGQKQCAQSWEESFLVLVPK